MRTLEPREMTVVSGGVLQKQPHEEGAPGDRLKDWLSKFTQLDAGGGALEEVLVKASKPGSGGFEGGRIDPASLLASMQLSALTAELGRGGGGGGSGEGGDGGVDSAVKKEVEKKAEETAEKLEEVVVEASRCGMPIAELFVLEHQQAGPAWENCFKNLSDSDKSNLKKALDIIAKGFEPSKEFNPLAVAFNVVFQAEREMLKHMAAAVAANNGFWFGENLATLAKGGWDSQLILGLIKGVFKSGTR